MLRAPIIAGQAGPRSLPRIQGVAKIRPRSPNRRPRTTKKKGPTHLQILRKKTIEEIDSLNIDQIQLQVLLRGGIKTKKFKKDGQRSPSLFIVEDTAQS